MPLRIRAAPDSLGELLSYLSGLGAEAEREDHEAIVVHPRHPALPGEPVEQDVVELDFVLRVWARQAKIEYTIERL